MNNTEWLKKEIRLSCKNKEQTCCVVRSRCFEKLELYNASEQDNDEEKVQIFGMPIFIESDFFFQCKTWSTWA